MQKLPADPESEEAAGSFRRVARAVHPHRIAGWFGDLGRLAAGLVILNARKTLFRRGGGRFRCPCQNPSDSGRAWETTCDAMLSWSTPVRFRRLCPLLKLDPKGEWRCSVNTADVRPFWGRAWGAFGGTALGLYLAGTIAVFAFLHSVGYPVNYVAVAWPPAWSRINQARSRFFYDKAERDFHENKPLPAIMALSQSYQLDPKNYELGRLLAELLQSGWSDNSSRVYLKLMADHPAERRQTAGAWLQALLARGDFTSIEKLALERMTGDAPAAPAWFNVLLFANRRTGNGAVLQKLITGPGDFPPYMREMCALELRFRQESPEDTLRLLQGPISATPAPLFVYYWIDRQLHAGLADAALQELNLHAGLLDGPDRVRLYLDAYALEGWGAILHDQVDQLLAAGVSAALIQLLCTHLIRHPDPVVLAKLFDAVYRRPPAAVAGNLGIYTSLFCAAGAGGDWVRLQAAAAELRALAESRFTSLNTAEAFFRGSPAVPVERCLRALPGLPVEISYALYDFSDLRRPARTSGRPIASASASATTIAP